MDINKFLWACLSDFSKAVDSTYSGILIVGTQKTNEIGEMLNILERLRPIGARAGIIIDFEDGKNLDNYVKAYYGKGYLNIVTRFAIPRGFSVSDKGKAEFEYSFNTFAIKPRGMLINHDNENIRKNFIFIKNSKISNEIEEDEERLITNDNLLIHPKGSYYTDTQVSSDLIKRLGRRFKF